MLQLCLPSELQCGRLDCKSLCDELIGQLVTSVTSNKFAGSVVKLRKAAVESVVSFSVSSTSVWNNSAPAGKSFVKYC